MAEDRMRILVLTSTWPRSVGDGTPSFVRDLSVELAHNSDVHVLTPVIPNAPPTECDSGVFVQRFRYAPKRLEKIVDGAMLELVRARPVYLLSVPLLVVAESLAIRRELKRFAPDVIHTHWLVPQGLALRLSFTRTPALLTTLGGDLYAMQGPLFKRLKRWIVRRFLVATTMNLEMRNLLLDLGVDRQRVFVEPMGADVDTIVAASLGVKAEPNRMVAVGRLVEKKGFGVLLEALHQLEDPPALTIVGEGPLRKTLEEASIGLDVTFAGQLRKSELAREVAHASVTVVPSVRATSGDKDGLPVALLESMAIGRAAIASDIPGINEIVRNGSNGVLVPPGDPIALAAAIRDCLENPDELRRLGERARESAAHYSVAAVAERYETLLRSVSLGVSAG